jgi:FkbH-like protein
VNFLEASRIVAKIPGGSTVPLHFAASGNVEPMQLYIKAAAALKGLSVDLITLPFGTLGQALLVPPNPIHREVILLLPWDLVPECDWRSGIPTEVREPDVLLRAAQDVVFRLGRRQCKILYLSAPIPPIYADPTSCAILFTGLSSLAAGLGAEFLDPACFALGGYLASGVPIAGRRSSEVAQAVVSSFGNVYAESYKVLVTDLDCVLWAGLAAEDGEEGIQCGPEGVGFRHFLYQSLLAKLKASGVVLAAVSRNDLNIAKAPIVNGKTLLSEEDFVGILASYEPKSVHIRRLSESLNLGLDSFVFVDDNPIELAEVGAALPSVKCLQFPEHDDHLAKFLQELAVVFARRTVSSEDKQRTEMYRRRLEVTKLSSTQGEGADLTEFLKNLRMELTIYDRTAGNFERAIQLINKTNQFNLNGRRLTDTDVAAILGSGGRLYTASLNDRTGGHGEILACLIDERRRIISLVLSCRVFQRQIEYAFTCWLLNRFGGEIMLAYAPTERNTPIRDFLRDTASAPDGWVFLGAREFLTNYARRLELFVIKEVGVD